MVEQVTLLAWERTGAAAETELASQGFLREHQKTQRPAGAAVVGRTLLPHQRSFPA